MDDIIHLLVELGVRASAKSLRLVVGSVFGVLGGYIYFVMWVMLLDGLLWEVQMWGGKEKSTGQGEKGKVGLFAFDIG